MIGLSLSFCVKDIIEGKVALESVEKIITGTHYTDRETFHTGMQQSYCHTYWKKDPEKAHQIAMQLWDEGKIHQPRSQGEGPRALLMAIGKRACTRPGSICCNCSLRDRNGLVWEQQHPRQHRQHVGRWLMTEEEAVQQLAFHYRTPA